MAREPVGLCYGKDYPRQTDLGLSVTAVFEQAAMMVKGKLLSQARD